MGAVIYDYRVYNYSNVNLMITSRIKYEVKQMFDGYQEDTHDYGSEYKTYLGFIKQFDYYKNDTLIKIIDLGVSEYKHALLRPLLSSKETISLMGYTSVIYTTGIRYPLSIKDLIHSFFEEITVYDEQGNIIMTIEDIVDQKDFLVPLRFEMSILITQEVVEAGRLKYAGRGTE
jgi:hypothetical protein